MDRDDVTESASRRQLERLVSADLRELTSQSDWTIRAFAERAQLSTNEFRALVIVALAESAPGSVTATTLRKQLGLSAAAITALARRLSDAGYLRRESYPGDRRKVILRATESGTDAVRAFANGVARDSHVAMAELPDEDLLAAHRAFRAMVEGMKGFRVTPDA
jgi:MarR family transcriptional regulator, organic hydroperoxide resistance regulator